MENKAASDGSPQGIPPEFSTLKTEPEQKISRSIHLSGDQVVITDELPGVYCDGTQYYDFKNVEFINNSGMANLIDLLKNLLERGIEVQFVNVDEKIKSKIKSMGLEHILNCDEAQKIEKVLLQ